MATLIISKYTLNDNDAPDKPIFFAKKFPADLAEPQTWADALFSALGGEPDVSTDPVQGTIAYRRLDSDAPGGRGYMVLVSWLTDPADDMDALSESLDTLRAATAAQEDLPNN